MANNYLRDKAIDELNNLLIAEYREALYYIYDLLVDTYEKVLVDEVPQISHLYQYNRYYTLLNKINTKLNDLGAVEVDLFTDKLTKLYEDTSNQISAQFDITTNIDDAKIKKILETPWVGKENYSDRIWKNKAEMLTKIKHNLVQSIITGTSLERFSKNLEANLVEGGYYPIRRLCNTEMSRMHLRATVDRYKELGLHKAKIIEAMDNRTCDKCAARNNTIINLDTISDGGDILAHPNCRATIAATIGG